MMVVEVVATDGARILRLLASRLDAAGVEDFKNALLSAGLASSDASVLDLHRVDFVDSSGLGAIVWAAKTARKSGGTLELCGVAGAVAQVFRLTRMERVFRFRDSASSTPPIPSSGS